MTASTMPDIPVLPYLGWHDEDKKRPVRQKLLEGIAAFERKHGRTPQLCVCHPDTAACLAVPTKTHPGDLPVEVRARAVNRHDFLIGDREVGDWS